MTIGSRNGQNHPQNLWIKKSVGRIALMYEDEEYQPFEILSWPLDMMKLKDQGTGLKYEDIKVDDWVAVLTANGDIDLERFGQVTKKFEKSNYEPMKVICVNYFKPPAFGPNPDIWAPKDLIKLSEDRVKFLTTDITDRVRNYRTFKEVK